VGDLVTVAAPMYAKFGLRNSRGPYPSGLHLRNDVFAVACERVQRAAIALEMLERLTPWLVQSGPGARRLCGGRQIPRPRQFWV